MKPSALSLSLQGLVYRKDAKFSQQPEESKRERNGSTKQQERKG